MKCRAIQYSDQMVCHICGLCWDTNDPDPPVCKPKEPESPRSEERVVAPKSAAQCRDEINQMLRE